jgi:hypothetical protein
MVFFIARQVKAFSLRGSDCGPSSKMTVITAILEMKRRGSQKADDCMHPLVCPDRHQEEFIDSGHFASPKRQPAAIEQIVGESRTNFH